MSARREFNVFSLSFLDCICCGFGAVILLFVLSKTGTPPGAPLGEREDPAMAVQELQQRCYELRSEAQEQKRKLRNAGKRLADSQDRLAKLKGDLAKARIAARERQDAGEALAELKATLLETKRSVEGRLTVLRERVETRVPSDAVVGFPIDSEYLVFVVDTSGSMRSTVSSLVPQKVKETLLMYDEGMRKQGRQLRGFQLMDTDGKYFLTTRGGTPVAATRQERYAWSTGRMPSPGWIRNTPGNLRAVCDSLLADRRTMFASDSPSSPVGGIREAVSKFCTPGRKVAIFVFGDEFGNHYRENAQQVVELVAAATGSNGRNQRNVRIHAVGFLSKRGPTVRKFSILMRGLCLENGGVFVGVNETDANPCRL